MADRSINRPDELKFDVGDILRQNHQFLRDRINPLEIIAEITDLSDFQKEGIVRACINEGDRRGVDKLVDSIKKRGKQCFVSFLRALKSQRYHDVVDELIKYGKINRNLIYDNSTDTSNELNFTPTVAHDSNNTTFISQDFNNDAHRNATAPTYHNEAVPINHDPRHCHNLPSANQRQQHMHQPVTPPVPSAACNEDPANQNRYHLPLGPLNTEGRLIGNTPVSYPTYMYLHNPNVGPSINPNRQALNNQHAPGSDAVNMMPSVAPVIDDQTEQGAALARQGTIQQFSVNQASAPEEVMRAGEDTGRGQQPSQQLNTPQGQARVTSRQHGGDTADGKKNREQITRITDSFKDFKLEDVENAVFEKWETLLNEDQNLLKRLGTKAKFTRKNILEMGRNESSGAFFLDELINKDFTIGQLIHLLDICPDIQKMVLDDIGQVQNNLNGSRPEQVTTKSYQYNIPQDRDVSHSEERGLEYQKLDSSEISIYANKDTLSRDENNSPDSSFEDNNKKQNVAKTPVENKEIDEENTCEEANNLDDDSITSDSEDKGDKIIESLDENSKSLVRDGDRPIEIQSDVENKLSEGNAAMAANSLKAVLQGEKDDVYSYNDSNRREQFLSAANETQSNCTHRNSEGHLEMNADRLKRDVITCAEDLGSMRLREETVSQFSAELTSDDDNITAGEHSSVLRSVKLAKDHHSVKQVKEEDDVEMDSPSTPTVSITQAVGDLNNSRSDNRLDNANIMRDVQKQVTYEDTISSEKRPNGRSSLNQGQTIQLSNNSVQHTYCFESSAETEVSDKVIPKLRASYTEQQGTALPVEAEDDPDCKCSEKPPDLERQRFNLEANNQPNMNSYRDIQNSIPDHRSVQQIGAAADTSEDEVCGDHIESDIERNIAQLNDQTFLKEQQL